MSETDSPSPDPPTGPPGESRKAPRKGTASSRHDALFRALFSDPVRAQALLRDHLPNDIAGLLAETPPEVLEGTFVDEALRGSQSDLLLQVELAKGGPAFVYVLVEFKSYPDPGVALQVVGYMIRIWQRHAQGKAERLRALPPIIPLVGYSGKASWTTPDDLADMVATDNPALVFLRGPQFILRQWAQMPPEELSRDAVPQAGLIALTQRALEHLEKLNAALSDNPVLLRQVTEYIIRDYPEADIDALIDRMHAAGANEMEEIVGTIAETLEARGIAKGEARGEARGIAKGRAEGRAEGKAEGLIRLLERRFGPLPQAGRGRIAEAGSDQIDRWMDRILDAKSLDGVLGDE